MESRLRVLLLIVAALALGGCSLWPFQHPARTPAQAADADDGSNAPVVEPLVTRPSAAEGPRDGRFLAVRAKTATATPHRAAAKARWTSANSV